MKAKDLAALAALGVAGYAAYNKLNEGKDKPKIRGELGSSKSAVEDSAGEYRSQELGKSRSANDGDAGEAEARMPAYKGREANRLDEIQDMYGNKSQSTAEYGPKTLSRQERDVPDRIMGRDAAGSRFTERAAAPVAVASPVRTPVVESRPLNSAGGPSRYSPRAEPVVESSNADVVSAPVQKKFALPGAQPAMGAFSRIVKPSVNTATAPSQVSDNSAMGAFSRVRAVPRNIKYATEAEKTRQQLIDEKNFDSQLNKERRAAVVDAISNVPSQVANLFAMPEKTFQNKTYVNSSGNVVRYAKGGVVRKMASGGMSSSKPKQSTASSRGDGIAQRGKTKGMIR